MHVAIAGWLLSSGPSGANRRLLGLLRNLQPHLLAGEQITVLHSGLPEHPPTELRWLEVKIPSGPTWRRCLAEARVLPRLLRELGATVYEQSFLPLPPWLPCPSALTIHDLRDLDGFARHNRLLSKLVLRQSWRRAAAIAVPSAFTMGSLVEHMGDRSAAAQTHIEVIPGGVDLDFFAYRQKEPFVEPYFLHVGHLERRKNLGMLLCAYGDFVAAVQGQLDEIPALFLVGADAGELEALKRQTRRLELQNHVHFLGQVGENRLFELYSGCTALLFPSLYEGFGLPALEALAMGRRVLASNAGALPEVLGEAGMILPGRDQAAWTQAMMAAVRPRGGAEVRACRQRAEQFSWDRSAAMSLALWRQL